MAYNILRRASINSIDEFIALVKLYGLYYTGDGTCYFGKNGPYLRNAGKVVWGFYLKLLDNAGFDYHPYIISGFAHYPKTEIEFRAKATADIDKLISLLENLKSNNKPLNIVWPENTLDF